MLLKTRVVDGIKCGCGRLLISLMNCQLRIEDKHVSVRKFMLVWVCGLSVVQFKIRCRPILCVNLSKGIQ